MRNMTCVWSSDSRRDGSLQVLRGFSRSWASAARCPTFGPVLSHLLRSTGLSSAGCSPDGQELASVGEVGGERPSGESFVRAWTAGGTDRVSSSEAIRFDSHSHVGPPTHVSSYSVLVDVQLRPFHPGLQDDGPTLHAVLARRRTPWRTIPMSTPWPTGLSSARQTTARSGRPP